MLQSSKYSLDVPIYINYSNFPPNKAFNQIKRKIKTILLQGTVTIRLQYTHHTPSILKQNGPVLQFLQDQKLPIMSYKHPHVAHPFL